MSTGPEVISMPVLEWSENRSPLAQIPYDHCISTTPIGRFVLTWKGWKPKANWEIGFDETPWGEPWYGSWETPGEAKIAAAEELARRIASMSKTVDTCGCGRPVRYTVPNGDGTQDACNKYARCPTYQELSDRHQFLMTQILQAGAIGPDGVLCDSHQLMAHQLQQAKYYCEELLKVWSLKASQTFGTSEKIDSLERFIDSLSLVPMITEGTPNQ